MIEEIKKHLIALEKERNIEILFSAESGSRAWGCPSPDSDYDIRIIFKRPFSDYLGIDEPKDSIDYFHGELLDINGWDIKKTLKLVRKSNATPFEWLQSPFIYSEKEGFKEALLEICKTYFIPKNAIHHYTGIAKNTLANNPLDGHLKLKKFFYILRPLMAAKWIIEKNCIPPMDIPNLSEILEDQEFKNKLADLLKLKEGKNEDFVYKIDPFLAEGVEDLFLFVSSHKPNKDQERKDSQLLNQFFKKTIEN